MRLNSYNQDLYEGIWIGAEWNTECDLHLCSKPTNARR